jgi:probable rRNA maturation factor
MDDDFEIEVEVAVDDPDWLAVEPGAEQLAATVAAAVLERLPTGASASVVVLLSGDEQVQDLNARFRGKDAPTNVLSFPAPGTAGGHLGDVILALGVCRREAREQRKPLAHHLQHLTAHGVLHLLGYDHETDAEADSMEALERAILAGLGVPDPYAERGA